MQTDTATSTTFVSYTRDDQAFVLKLARDLRAASIDLWVDQMKIRVGDAWDEAVQHALTTATTVLVVLSPEAVASDNVLDEVAFALDGGRRVVPIVYQKCDVPLRLKRLQYVDFTADYDSGLEQLRAALDPASEPAPEAPQARHSTRRHASPKRVTRHLQRAVWPAVVVLAVSGGWIGSRLLESQPIQKTVAVSGNKELTPTGIDIKKGQSIEISAVGSVVYQETNGAAVSVTPDGDLNDRCPRENCPVFGEPSAKLVGRIGKGEYFPIGSYKSLTAKESGELFLRTNDPDPQSNKESFWAWLNVR
jgi:hypothetical protein